MSIQIKNPQYLFVFWTLYFPNIYIITLSIMLYYKGNKDRINNAGVLDILSPWLFSTLAKGGGIECCSILH